jgi:hypothetical protein
MDNESNNHWEPYWPPPPRPSLRGLLPVPPDVEKLMAREKARLLPFVTDESEKRMRDDFTLQYYYEGQTIAYRRTPQGVEVLAVGAVEVGELANGLTQEELLTICIGQP